jgi:hypothetical protein
MTAEIEITFEGDHVRVRADGAKDYEVAEEVWTGVASTCEEHQCFKVLGTAHTTVPLEVMDAYDHARLFEGLNIDSRYRIAWVELNPNNVDIIAFTETVLMNRGLPGKVFSDVDEARSWLLE